MIVLLRSKYSREKQCKALELKFIKWAYLLSAFWAFSERGRVLSMQMSAGDGLTIEGINRGPLFREPELKKTKQKQL